MGNSYSFNIFSFAIFLLFLVSTIPGVAGTQDMSPVSAPDNGGNQSSISSGTDTFTIEEEVEPLYEIQFVSSEVLSKIISNSNSGDDILKAGPGMIIGVSTPGYLYLRSDMKNDDYLLKNRNVSDMEDKISKHLVNIAFGRDNANISILKKDLKYKIWFDAVYTRDDINFTLNFTRFFNEISQTTQFEDEEVETGELMDNYENAPYHYFNIRIVTKQYLGLYKDKKYDSNKEMALKGKSGNSIGFLTNEYVYLWDGLEGEERTYYLLKSLLWSMGLHGETTDYPDSFFYSQAKNSATLSQIDIEAIKLLYGGRLSEGMTREEVNKALDIVK